MDKEDTAHVYNGMLLNHKQEQNNAIHSNMDEPKDCHTEWSKSDTERQISHQLYVASKNKRYKWAYLPTEVELQR